MVGVPGAPPPPEEPEREGFQRYALTTKRLVSAPIEVTYAAEPNAEVKKLGGPVDAWLKERRVFTEKMHEILRAVTERVEEK